MEGTPIALNKPQLYLKYELSILPPLVTWAAMVIFQRWDGVWHSQSCSILQIFISLGWWVGFYIVLDLWKYDVKLVLDKHISLVYYMHSTLVH
jgi:hypothetical protein